MDEPTNISIKEAFEGKCVLLTGATGFLGKVLLEKLLRSVPGIQKVIIIVRFARNKELSELLEHRVFDRVRQECPGALNKVHAMVGDVISENLGLDESQLNQIKEVSFVFHCAANVRFDDEPKKTLSVNLLGVKNVLDICREIPCLEAFIHVSTAFSFCNNPVISEETYQELMTPGKTIQILSWLSNEQLRTLCANFLQGRPSMYHFSKALAEILITELDPPLPAVIVRPSIITASVNEPYPGWIDNLNGPTGFIAVCGKGVVRTLLVNPDVNADWVPVDIVANTLIVAAHYAAVRRRFPNTVVQLSIPSRIPIINCTCPEQNLITWMKIVKICLPFLVKYPSKEVLGMPGGTVTSSIFRYKASLFISHYIPAFISDFVAIITGRNPRLVRLYKRFHRVMGHLQIYTTNKFVFRSNNMMKLVENMNPQDSEFNIDQRSLNWAKYIENYVLGVRRYYLQEEDDTLPDARKKMMRIHYGWLTLKVVSAAALLLLLRKCTNSRLPKAWLFQRSVLLAAIDYIRCKQQEFFR